MTPRDHTLRDHTLRDTTMGAECVGCVGDRLEEAVGQSGLPPALPTDDGVFGWVGIGPSNNRNDAPLAPSGNVVRSVCLHFADCDFPQFSPPFWFRNSIKRTNSARYFSAAA